jgi:hypothetical protein
VCKNDAFTKCWDGQTHVRGQLDALAENFGYTQLFSLKIQNIALMDSEKVMTSSLGTGSLLSAQQTVFTSHSNCEIVASKKAREILEENRLHIHI